jgi:integrase
MWAAKSTTFSCLPVISIQSGCAILGSDIIFIDSRPLHGPNNCKHRLILMLAYGCGLRSGELSNLKPADIDLDRDIITITTEIYTHVSR